MSKRITIDPISRIEGHLRVDLEVEGGSVSNAWASCTMWRGIENILKGRDPREAWLYTQRFCGVCTTVHAIASVRSVEDALKLEIPPNAQYIRNLILINHGIHDHIVHFYHLSALDFVDVLRIPAADPAKTNALAESLTNWPGNSKKALLAAQDKVKGVVDSGQLGIFTNGYWGHPAMRLSPEVNLLAFAHYVQALEYQRKSVQAVAILGSKSPHIQNLTVGGVSNAINLDSLATLGMDRLVALKKLMDDVKPFVDQVYLPDVCAVAAMYPEWFSYGKGVPNYLAAADLPTDSKNSQFDLPGGYILDGNLSAVHRFAGFRDAAFVEGVTEETKHAWYKGEDALHPWKGETEPQFTDWQADGKYSWVKAPRFKGRPMQVGPLAQVLVGYAGGDPLTRKHTDKALELISTIGGRKIGVEQLQSTMGRHVARAIRCSMLAELGQKHWQLLVDNIAKGDMTTHNDPKFPSGEIQGLGVHEAPRGVLSHWTVIRDGKIANYQAVVPSTWNASPRDAKGQRGPYEAALLHNPIADPVRPLEAIRTVHSFDPCMACACHTFDPEGRPVAVVKVI